MNDAQHPLDLLAHDVVSPVPPGLLDTARAARRRRVRGRLAVGGAVAAVAVVALAVTLPGGSGSAPVAREDAPRPASTPAAPADTKWVATGGYMVAIPVAWEQTEPPCSDGILTGEGPGFYYIAGDMVMNDCRATGLATRSPTVTLTTSRAGEQDVRCDPTCSQTVEAGGVELRVRDLDSAAAVRAVVDTLQPLPASWVVDPVSGRATPYDVSVPKSRLVTDRDRVLGAWRVVQVDGGPVPPGAERGLDVAAAGRASLELTYSDGVNGLGLTWRVRTDGELVGGQMYSTTAMCAPPRCAPSGFGVMEATQLRLTPTGDLVLVGADGTALAVYERA